MVFRPNGVEIRQVRRMRESRPLKAKIGVVRVAVRFMVQYGQKGV